MIPTLHLPANVPDVPFYSQFHDIKPIAWQKVGCGIASLAMVIEYYKPETVSVNTLLTQAITAGAYNQSAGWKHKDLILLSTKYGLDGASYDLSKSTQDKAFAELKKSLKDGPIMASIHYKFDPKSSIPHLIVVDGVDGNTIYYNDPSAKNGEMTISSELFLKGWKKKFIVLRPKTEQKKAVLAQHKTSIITSTF